MRIPAVTLWLWASLTGGVAAEPPGAPRDLPVLNEGCYWRYHFTYAPLMVDAERLKSEGLKCLGEREYNRLKAAVVRRHRRQGRKLADWTADVRAGVGPWSFDGRADAVMTHFRTDPPPPDGTESLTGGEDEAAIMPLRRHTHTGRPLGSDRFLARLEKALGRRVRALPVGRPRRNNKHANQKKRPLRESTHGAK